MVIYEAGGRPSLTDKSASALILDCPACRTVRNTFLLFISQLVYHIPLYQIENHRYRRPQLNPFRIFSFQFVSCNKYYYSYILCTGALISWDRLQGMIFLVWRELYFYFSCITRLLYWMVVHSCSCYPLLYYKPLQLLMANNTTNWLPYVWICNLSCI